MAKKIISIITAIIVIAAIGCFIAYYISSNKVVYNTMSNVNGNTAGNLQNNGLFCELEDKVYFSNPFDEGKLYSMDADGKNVTKLNDETVSSINAYGKYLYFSKNNLTGKNSTAAFRGTLFSAMRSDLNGKNLVTLCDEYSGKLALIGNKVYFQRYINNNKKQTIGSLYSVGIDQKDLKEVADEDINPAGVFGTYIFYTGTKHDHNIYKFNTITDSSSVFYEGNCYMCIPDGSDLYFIDTEDDYKLKCIGTSSKKEAKTIINQRISTYNIDKNYIYFQIDDENEGMLCRMRKTDSSDYDIIAEGHYNNINVTSKYIYFYKLNEETNAYRTPASGAINVQKLSEVFDMSLYK